MVYFFVVRKTKEDWLDKGLEVLADSGYKALTLERLLEAMRLTRGSFYHHFEHIAAFHVQLAAHWESRFTDQFIAQADNGPPGARLELLLNQVVEARRPGELSLRVWALHSPEVAAVLNRVDQRRVAYVENLLVTQGFSAPASLRGARQLYAALLGSQAIKPPLANSDLKHLFSAILAHLNHTQESSS